MIKDVFATIGSSQKTLEAITYSNSKGQHVLAGDIRDPTAVEPMSKFITDWVGGLTLEKASRP
jgi:hypothetical protein